MSVPTPLGQDPRNLDPATNQQFSQGQQEGQPPVAGQAPPPPAAPEVPAADPPAAPTPPAPVGGGMFTKEQVDQLLAEARREEKDKLYPEIQSLKENMGQLSAAEQARQEEARQAADAVEAARKAAEEADMDAKTLLARKETEWQAQIASMQEQIALRDAAMEREREYQQLQSYIAQRIAETADTIPPSMRIFIKGNTPEEVETAIVALQETTASSMAAVQEIQGANYQAQQMSGVTAPPVGPLENEQSQQTITAQDIRDMPMDTYAQQRPRLLGSARNTRERGLYS